MSSKKGYLPVFYVYEHWRPDIDVCFYVGKGKGYRASAMFSRNDHHKNVQKKLAKLGMCVEVRLVGNGLVESAAFALEIERIAFWQECGVSLTNKSLGGEGPTGHKHTEDWKRAMSKQMTGRFVSEETRKRLSESGIGKRVGQKRTPEQCARLSAALIGISHGKGRTFSEEHKRKLSEARRGKKRSLETCAKMSAAMKGHVVSEETKAKIGKANSGRVFTLEHREKLRAANKKRVYIKGRKASPETREKMREAQLRRQERERAERSIKDG